MMGVILIGLSEFVKKKKGKLAVEEVFKGSGVNPSSIMEQRIYPEETFQALFKKASEVVETDPHELQIEWGRFMAKMVNNKFPVFFNDAETAKGLLEKVPEIHFKVFPTIVGKQSQKMNIKESGKDYIIFEYRSPNGLCTFMKAMIDETVKKYDAKASIVETHCVRKNDPLCEVKVVFL